MPTEQELIECLEGKNPDQLESWIKEDPFIIWKSIPSLLQRKLPLLHHCIKENDLKTIELILNTLEKIKEPRLDLILDKKITVLH